MFDKRSVFHRWQNRLWKIFTRRLQPYLYNTPYIYGEGGVFIGRDVGLNNVYINTRSGDVRIGDNVIFGPNVMLLTGVHDATVFDSRRPTLINAGRDIEIGDCAFIGGGAIIVGPVKIGKNSVIGAGSVVTQDVPEGAFVAGIPAAVKKILAASGEKEYNTIQARL